MIKINIICTFVFLAMGVAKAAVIVAKDVDVKFGIANDTEKKMSTGAKNVKVVLGVKCSNETMGLDPSPGNEKFCEVIGKKTYREGETMMLTLTSAELVDYGSKGSATMMTKKLKSATRYNCSVGVFGKDPAKGLAKKCYIEDKVVAQENDSFIVPGEACPMYTVYLTRKLNGVPVSSKREICHGRKVLCSATAIGNPGGTQANGVCYANKPGNEVGATLMKGEGAEFYYGPSTSDCVCYNAKNNAQFEVLKELNKKGSIKTQSEY